MLKSKLKIVEKRTAKKKGVQQNRNAEVIIVRTRWTRASLSIAMVSFRRAIWNEKCESSIARNDHWSYLFVDINLLCLVIFAPVSLWRRFWLAVASLVIQLWAFVTSNVNDVICWTDIPLIFYFCYVVVHVVTVIDVFRTCAWSHWSFLLGQQKVFGIYWDCLHWHSGKLLKAFLTECGLMKAAACPIRSLKVSCKLVAYLPPRSFVMSPNLPSKGFSASKTGTWQQKISLELQIFCFSSRLKFPFFACWYASVQLDRSSNKASKWKSKEDKRSSL